MPDYPARLSLLRNAMKEKNIDACLIPSADPHFSEHLPRHWRVIEWLTGFSGSAGTLVVTSDFAGLWTDSRYFLQAGQQLVNTGCILMNPASNGREGYINWIASNLAAGTVLAFDGRLVSSLVYDKIEKDTAAKEIRTIFDSDLVADVWSDRPALPVSVAFDHPLNFCGRERSAKLEDVRNEMRKINAGYHLLADPSDIMWLLNIRGADYDYEPVIRSYAVIGEEQVLLFVEESSIPPKLAREFDALGIVMLPCEEIEGMLEVLEPGRSILIDPGYTSAAIRKSISGTAKVIEGISRVALLKAAKNPVEIRNLENAMLRDGVALTRFLYWMEMNREEASVTELSASARLDSLRAAGDWFISPSFRTIAAWNPNGALPHYTASPDSDASIGEKGIFLVDSGGHYMDGTTDITRTIAIGIPTARQKTDFTLVLKGLIALSTVRFPERTRGVQLDILARLALWKKGLNYGHGTGHGVGYCLNVHEGPQSISPAASGSKAAFFEAGMLTSNEPAVYREGEYGIRTENMMVCCEDEETEFGKFYRFETLSLCHMDRNLIEKSLLDPKEIAWIDNYHYMVCNKLSPQLDEIEREWLKGKTMPL